MKRIVVLVVALCAWTTVLVAPPASAASTANVYVVVNDRVCSGAGGKSKAYVRGILASIDKTNYRQKAWDQGDNISYPKVKLNTTNQFSAQVRCYKKVTLFWQEVGTRPVWGKFRPTKANQTFWIG